MPVIDDIFLQHLGPSLARQLALLQATEGLPCNVDLAAGRVSFGDRYTFPIQLLGREDETGAWTWSWALENTPKALLRAAGDLKKYGKRHGLDILYVPSFHSEEIGGDELAVLSCGISGSDSFFVADTEDGLLFFLIPDLGGRIPRPATVLFLSDVIARMLDSYELQEPKPALRAYLLSEGYEIDEASRRWTARHPRGSRIELAFDARGRLAKIDGTDG